MNSVDYQFLSIFIATVVYMAIGFLWYSPFVFGKAWMKFSKLTSTKMELKTLILSFINSFVLCFFFSLLIGFLGVTSVIDGIFVGFGIWIGFVVTTHLSSVIWAKTSFRLYLVNIFYWLISLCVVGAILGS